MRLLLLIFPTKQIFMWTREREDAVAVTWEFYLWWCHGYSNLTQFRVFVFATLYSSRREKTKDTRKRILEDGELDAYLAEVGVY